MYGYSIVHLTEVTMLAKKSRVILEHRYVNNFSGLDCAQRGLEDINMRMNVAPNLPGSSGNFYIVHQSYRNANCENTSTKMCKCNLHGSHGCPFVIRMMHDARGAGQVHLLEIREHCHVAPGLRRAGLSSEQRVVLQPYLAGGGLRPMDAMRILADANNGTVETAGRSNSSFRTTILGPFLQRQRNRAIGDSYGEILEFARTNSLFTPGHIYYSFLNF